MTRRPNNNVGDAVEAFAPSSSAGCCGCASAVPQRIPYFRLIDRCRRRSGIGDKQLKDGIVSSVLYMVTDSRRIIAGTCVTHQRRRAAFR